MTNSETLKIAAAYWDNFKTDVVPRRFWQFPICTRAINRRIGFDAPQWSGALISALRSRIGERPLQRGISIGCGAGAKELEYLKAGAVGSFDLFEISEERIRQGKQLYAASGFAEQGKFSSANGLERLAASSGVYDLVLWDNSLHHMAEPRKALEFSVQALKAGGALILNEFVGPNRFQWTDSDLSAVALFRRGLPARFFDIAAGARMQVPRTVVRPTIEYMMATDPTEAIDSEAILPAVRELMPQATVWMLGGVIYHLGLNDVLANFRMPEDEALLEMALCVDEFATLSGLNHYAAGLFVKP